MKIGTMGTVSLWLALLAPGARPTHLILDRMPSCPSGIC